MKQAFINFGQRIKSLFGGEMLTTLEAVQTKTVAVTKTVDGYVMPVRETIFKRFPVLFSLLVTFGVIATFLGVEQVLLQYELLRTHPELILLTGVTILIFTGRLYKKLG